MAASVLALTTAAAASAAADAADALVASAVVVAAFAVMNAATAAAAAVAVVVAAAMVIGSVSLQSPQYRCCRRRTLPSCGFQHAWHWGRRRPVVGTFVRSSPDPSNNIPTGTLGKSGRIISHPLIDAR